MAMQTTALLNSARILRTKHNRCWTEFSECYQLQLELKQQQQQQQKRTFKIVDFAVPADHRVKLKENEKKNKYPDLARVLKKLWNMKVTFIPIVIGTLGTVTKGLVQGLDDLEIRRKVETILTTILLRLARILRRVLETRGD